MDTSSLSFDELPKFIIAGVPREEFQGLRVPVWLTRDDSVHYRPTTRYDFALWSLDCERIRELFKYTHKIDGYYWKIRVRAGSRRVFTD